jgi:N-carbamoylputrescine amidase
MNTAKTKRQVTVAATQMACDNELENNLQRAEALVREAHDQGSQIILIQELFASPYFCKDQDARYVPAHRQS